MFRDLYCEWRQIRPVRWQWIINRECNRLFFCVESCWRCSCTGPMILLELVNECLLAGLLLVEALTD